MSKPRQKRGSLSREDVDVTQRKLDLDSRTQRQVSIEEQSLECRKLANDKHKKSYTKWITKVNHLEVEDLYTDFRDGKLLIQLLEVVFEEKIHVRTRKGVVPEMETFLSRERIEKALDFLQQHNVRLENIRPKDIEEGKEKETLALIWAIILYEIVKQTEQTVELQPLQLRSNQALEIVTDLQLQKKTSQVPTIENQEQTATKTLLQWCQKTTQGYRGVKVTNFTTSWKDGLAFNAIIHKHRSDLIDFESLQAENILYNLNNAFDVAERELGIPKILDTEDMISPDTRSVVMYISLYYSFFCLKHPEPPQSPVVVVVVPTPDPPHVERAQLQESGNETQASTGSRTQTPPVVPILVSTPDPPQVERAQHQESGNETQASTGSRTQTTPVVPISVSTPDPPKVEKTQTQQLAGKPQSANKVQTRAPTGTGTSGTPTTQPSTQSGPPPPPYSPPKYTPHPAYQQPYQQPYHQQPYPQPYHQQPYPQPYYQQPYQQQPYRPAYYQQPYAAPPMQMMQQQTVQVQTGLGLLTVGAQQGAGGQSSSVNLGSTTVGAAPRLQPAKPAAKPTAHPPAKNKGKKSKK